MAKPRQLYESKITRARQLPVGTWFAWPDTLPRRYKYYQPKLYRSLGGGKVSPSFYEDFGIWQHKGGVNSPGAAYDRCNEIAKTLNAMHADESAAIAYIKKIRTEQMASASLAIDKIITDAQNRNHNK